MSRNCAITSESAKARRGRAMPSASGSSAALASDRRLIAGLDEGTRGGTWSDEQFDAPPFPSYPQIVGVPIHDCACGFRRRRGPGPREDLADGLTIIDAASPPG